MAWVIATPPAGAAPRSGWTPTPIAGSQPPTSGWITNPLALFGAAGTLSVSIALTIATVPAALSGAGTLTASGHAIIPRPAALVGAGTLGAADRARG